MNAETPAEGILKRRDWGDAQYYQVVCECGDDDHNHNVWIETDDTNEVTVTIYTTQKTRWWDMTRWATIWTLLTRGYIEYESTIVMTPQQALNYATTLKKAVSDLSQT